MKIVRLITVFGLAILAISAMAATKLVTVDDTQTYPWDVERDYVLADRIPIGTILSYSSVTAPSGYFLCDGSAVSRSTYSNLFSVISTNFGVGDGSTTFTLPDLRNRFALGVSSGLGAVGGTNQVTLTVAQMPKHLHNLHFGLGGTGTIADPLPNQTHAYGSSYTNMDQMGGDAAHTNMPPYQTVCYIIKHSDVILTTANNALRTDGTIPMTGTLETPSIKITSGATNGAVWVATNAAGQGALTVFPKFIAKSTVAKVYTNAVTYGQIPFETTLSKVGGSWDGTNWSPGVVGQITLWAYIELSGPISGTGPWTWLRFDKNGNPNQGSLTVSTSPIDRATIMLRVDDYCDNATNKYSVRLQQVLTGTMTNFQSYFSGAVLP